MTWAPDYVTVAELKAFLRIESADTVDDAQAADAVTTASRAVDRATNRQFGQVNAVEPRIYTARFDCSRGLWVIEIDDLMDATGLTVVTTGGTVDVFTKQPVNAAAKSKPWTRLVVADTAAVKPKGTEGEVTVTAKWGWTAVPTAIKLATKLQAARFFKRQDAPFGVAGSPELGSEMRLLARVDPDVAVSVRDYVRQQLKVG